MKKTLTRTIALTLVAGTLGLGAAAFTAETADARNHERLRSAIRGALGLAQSGRNPSVNIQLGIQGGRGRCDAHLNQSADINIGYVLQRCDENNASINQNGVFNHAGANQRSRR